MGKPNPMKGKHLIFWTEREKKEVATEVIRLQEVYQYDTILNLVRKAQKVLPVERQRNIRTINDVAWIRFTMHKIQDTQKKTDDINKLDVKAPETQSPEVQTREVSDESVLNMSMITTEALMVELTKRLVEPLIEQITQAVTQSVSSQLERINVQIPQLEVTRGISVPLVHSVSAPKVKLPTILIAGLLPSQENVIKAAFETRANLKLWNKDMSGQTLGEYARNSDHAIIFTSHVAHQHEDKIRGNLGPNTQFYRNHGGMTNLKLLIERILDKDDGQ
jgi:hypothetical protein